MQVLRPSTTRINRLPVLASFAERLPCSKRTVLAATLGLITVSGFSLGKLGGLWTPL